MSDSDPHRLHLFEGFGVELEYMIVDRDTLDVLPIADRFFEAVAGEQTGDFEPDGPGGVISYSNELALHVLELKTTRPVASLEGLAERFTDHVRQCDAALEPLGARLLPGAMHPWMEPDRETKLWPHETGEIYRAFNRIFGCRGHGWSNLQSTHLNLPFADADEFGRLHAAIRLVLPLLPALAAGSPIADGRVTGLADTRLDHYRRNCAKVPLVTAAVVPEPVFTPDDYQQRILQPMYAAIAPHDPQGILQHEWLNARGAIARFDRGSIEIRVLDIQEHPGGDLATLELVVAVLRGLVDERWSSTREQQAVEVEPLAGVMDRTIRHAEAAVVDHAPLLRLLGVEAKSMAAGDLWQSLAERCRLPTPAATLSGRLRRAVGEAPSRDRLRGVYQELALCLVQDRPFAA